MSILHEDLDTSFKLKGGALGKFESFAESVISNKDKLSIVFDEESVKGYLFADVIYQPPVYYHESIGMITEISVDSGSRRSGIGYKLLKYGERWFSNMGIKIIDCQVASRNPISSNFWEKNGYIEHSKICRKLLEQQ